MKISKKNSVKSGRGDLKSPYPSLVRAMIKHSRMLLKSPNGLTTVPGSCISVVSAPSSVALKNGSCRKSSLKRSATKTLSRSNHSNWFKTVLQMKTLKGFKACHVDKRTFFGDCKTRVCGHLHETYREALVCSQLMRAGK